DDEQHQRQSPDGEPRAFRHEPRRPFLQARRGRQQRWHADGGAPDRYAGRSHLHTARKNLRSGYRGGGLFFAANYAISFWSVFVLRRQEPDAPRPYRVWGYPWTTALALTASIAFLAGA